MSAPKKPHTRSWFDNLNTPKARKVKTPKPLRVFCIVVMPGVRIVEVLPIVRHLAKRVFQRRMTCASDALGLVEVSTTCPRVVERGWGSLDIENPRNRVELLTFDRRAGTFTTPTTYQPLQRFQELMILNQLKERNDTLKGF